MKVLMAPIALQQMWNDFLSSSLHIRELFKCAPKNQDESLSSLIVEDTISVYEMLSLPTRNEWMVVMRDEFDSVISKPKFEN